MRINEQDERFFVSGSTLPGAGNGLFARASLAEGDRLAIPGVTVEAESIADRCTRYADSYKFRWGNDLLIPLGFGSMVNHSRNPNMEKCVDGSGVSLRVLRTVQAGEELFFCYSGYAQERFLLA